MYLLTLFLLLFLFLLIVLPSAPRRDSLRRALLRYAPTASSERVDLALAEILSDLGSDGSDEPVLTQEAWCNVMASWLQVSEALI
jgi:hypothetical protein